MKQFLLAWIACFALQQVNAQTSFYQTSKGDAINGYDAVAYFTQNKAVAGSDSFTTKWSGAIWKFSSKADLDSFQLKPEKYAPQYGGYCAYGCSENHKAPTDPTAFTIANDKLYLNYNQNVRTMWKGEMAKRIETADAKWIALSKQP